MSSSQTADADHDVGGTQFFVRSKGARFAIFERGTGARGMARLRATHRTLRGALELAASLSPSTPAEILAGIQIIIKRDAALYRKLVKLGEPGAPLFILSQGRGYEAVSEGLVADPVESLFGPYGLNCWLISWRDPDGNLVKGLYCNAREDAERAWWILRDGLVVAGGPQIFDEARALELAEQFGGTAVKGTGWATPDPEPVAPVTRCSREGCGRPLRSKASIARGMSKACAIKEALRIATAAWSQAQRDKAEAAIVAGKLRPTSREGMYHVTSSDGVTVYLTSVLSCPCVARGLCWHRAAAALADAYKAVA